MHGDTDYIDSDDDDLLGITKNPNNFETFRSYHQPRKYPRRAKTNSWCSNEPEKGHKYQRIKELPHVKGFIVNIHDATNFDIDLKIPVECQKRYNDVVTNRYFYKDLPADFLDNPDIQKIGATEPSTGKTFRCRLRGVGISQKPIPQWKSRIMTQHVRQLTDRTDGWVVCTISDIDVYRRLLVDIVVHTKTGPINLREFLLEKSQQDPDPIFYPYPSRHEHSTVSQ
jgi:hypothetical protein